MATFERITHGVRRGGAVTIVVDGAPVRAFDGESVMTALLAADCLTFRHAPKTGAPRGAFCAMGVCFDCLVTIDGVTGVRSCMVTVCDSLTVETRSTHDRGPAFTSVSDMPGRADATRPSDAPHGDPRGSV